MNKNNKEKEEIISRNYRVPKHVYEAVEEELSKKGKKPSQYIREIFFKIYNEMK